MKGGERKGKGGQGQGGRRMGGKGKLIPMRSWNRATDWLWPALTASTVPS